MCDIDNPLCGPNGASAVFGPQKGADPAMVKVLDNNLKNMAEIVSKNLGKDIIDIPGGGAAGGFGAGSVAFFNSQLQMGIDTVLDLTDFDAVIDDSDLIITGEGKIDSQSLRGKVVIGVSRRAKLKNKPVVALVGASENQMEDAYKEGVSGIFPINPIPLPFDEIKKYSEENLRFTTHNLMNFIKTMEKYQTKTQ